MYTTMEYKCLRCYDGWDIYTWICRTWGVLTALALWGVGVEALFLHIHTGSFIVFSALIVSFFEAVFVITFWVETCNKEEGSCCVRFWQALGWVDDWKKGILYIILSVGSLLYPKKFWLGIVSGSMLLVCAVFYSIKTIKTRHEENEKELQAKGQTYDRFDAEVQEDIEGQTLGSETEDVMFSDDAESVPDNVGDQDEILDV